MLTMISLQVYYSFPASSGPIQPDLNLPFKARAGPGKPLALFDLETMQHLLSLAPKPGWLAGLCFTLRKSY
jgi:hypothetical protein